MRTGYNGGALDNCMIYVYTFFDATLNSVIVHITNVDVEDQLHWGKTSRKPRSHVAMR